jgi:hypothetical protein
MKTISTILIALFAIIVLQAQAPQAFNYQGVARDLSGNPIPNQNIGLRIAILQGSMNGVEVYKETFLVTTNNLGLFNIQVGSGNVVTGDFSNIGWGGDVHFLKIEMDENGGTNYQLIGTSQLLSVPYALYAESSGDSKWSDNAVGIHYNQGKVGIGLNYPSSLFHISKSVDDAALIIEADTSDNDEDNNPRIEFWQDGGYANSSIGLNLFEDGNHNGLYFANTTSAFGGIYFATKDAPTGWQTAIVRMTISTIGNVGVGTTEPKSKLQISDGDIYIEDINKGVIMKSQNGQCWRYTPDNTGQLVATAVSCPN